MATNGDAEKWDARKGEQPRGTVMKQNLIHDVGIYEKQSSGWGHNKACLATVEDNIMYNLPRAVRKMWMLVVTTTCVCVCVSSAKRMARQWVRI